MIVNARFLTQKLTGVQRYATEISRQLKLLLPETRFLSPRSIVQKEIAGLLDAESVGTKGGHLWEQLELPLALCKESEVLLCLANSAPLAYPNKIVTIHDTAFLNTNWVSWKFKLLYCSLLPQILRTSRYLVTVSEFSKQEIVKHFNVSPNRIDVIPNAVSADFRALALQETKNQYGDYIMGLSSLEPRKNFRNLILAFNRLCERAFAPDLKLLIVGSRESIYQNPQLSDVVQGNPNIVFTGYVDDSTLASLYQHAKAFVFPSFYEGFGLPPLEAMAFGCPTIVSNVASLPEVCGDASVYIDPNDIESIQKGIESVLSSIDLRQKLVASGYQRVDAYSWERSAKHYIDLVSRV